MCQRLITKWFMRTKQYLAIIVLVIFLVAFVLIGHSYLFLGEDWKKTLGILDFLHPYAQNKTLGIHHAFFGVPWTLFFIPHMFLPMSYSNAINMLLNIIVPMLVIAKYKGNYKTIAMVFLSPLFWLTLAVNNIDWIPLLAFLLPPHLMAIPLSVKPQSLGAMYLIILKREYEKNKLKGIGLLLIPLIVVVIISTVIWPTWFIDIQQKLPINVDINISPFPVLVPVGLWLLHRAYKNDDLILAACATPFLVPFIGVYSISSTATVLCCKSRRMGFVVFVAQWVIYGVEIRRLLFGGY